MQGDLSPSEEAAVYERTLDMQAEVRLCRIFQVMASVINNVL